MSETIHKTRVTGIGTSASDFLEEKMIIFFHEDVPPYLADFCYLIVPGEGGYDIRVGDALVIGNTSCPITAIGEVALENFAKLGHLTVRFDGASAPAQPGTMHVYCPVIPQLAVGTNVSFVRG